jgi:urease accessory protein
MAEAGPDGGTRLAVLRSQAPVTLRPTAAGVYLAASAAGPLGGDDVELAVTVGPGATLVLRTVAATVALAGASRFTWVLAVARGGRLAVLPEPTVVAAGADHHATTRAAVEGGGALVLREEVLLGRYGERGGRHRGTVAVDADGVPLLRSEVTLDGADPATSGPASAVAGRACGSLLVVYPDGASRPAGAAGPGWAAMPLAGPGLLVAATCDDAAEVRAALDRWQP